MKVAVVHDWLNGMRGGERVLEAILEIFPEAHLYTLFQRPERLSPAIRAFPIHVSPLQGAPLGLVHYRYYLPLLPWFASRLDVRGYDLIVSSSHCVAKGVRKRADAKHVSYVHAPMRYVWDRYDDYFGPGRASALTRIVARIVRPFLRAWDRRVSTRDRVDVLVANSRFIAEKIRLAYGRADASVVHPFVDVDRFAGVSRRAGEEYLVFGAFAPYKRVDLVIRAFLAPGFDRRLVIAGGGQDLAKLRALVGEHERIRYVENPSQAEVPELYARARALVFPGVEDFGITPLEAMAAGCPVIALGAGGALETVTDATGVFFTDQSEAGLRAAILAFEERERTRPFDPAVLRARAAEFTKAKFQAAFRAEVDRALAGSS